MASFSISRVKISLTSIVLEFDTVLQALEVLYRCLLSYQAAVTNSCQLLPFMPWFPANVEKSSLLIEKQYYIFSECKGDEFSWDCWVLYNPVWGGGLSRFVWFCCKFLKPEFEILKKYKRPGRDVRSVFSNRISNPGRRSDSPPY